MADQSKTLLVNTTPEPVTETQAARVLRMVDLQPGTMRAASAAPQREQGGQLFKDGERVSLKGCTFEVMLVEGALMVVKYVGLTNKQKRQQIRGTGTHGRGRRR